MAKYIDDRRYQADMAELEAYRSTGLSPKEVCRLMVYSTDPAPAPMQFPLDEDGFSLGQGLLEDDGYDPALIAMERQDEGRWDK